MAPRADTETAAPAPAHRAAAPASLSLLLVVALAGLFLAVSLTPLTNNDIWLHMANGAWIIDHGKVPLTDPYSFSAAGNRFHAHEWLAGVIFHLVYLATGVSGLILFKTLLGGLALVLVVLAGRRVGAGPLPLSVSFLVALVIVNSRFLERPEMFSYMFTALYVAVLALEHVRLGASPPAGSGPDWKSLLWLLVPVQWAWVQIHGYFLTGFGLLGAFLAAETLRRMLAPRRPPRTRLAAGWAALAVMALLGLANPNGPEIYVFPFQLAGGDNIFMRTVFEWKPTFTTSAMTQSSMFLGFCAWLALLAISCLDKPSWLRRRRAWHVVAIAGLLALLAVRAVLAADANLPEAAARLGSGAGLKAAAVDLGTRLPPSAWLWSPAELLGSLTGNPDLQAAILPALAPLRLAGTWGDDIFTLLWIALAIWAAIGCRRSAAPGVAILATLLTFAYLLADRWAVPLVLLTVAPALALAAWRKRLPLWQLAVTGVFLALALRQNRNIVNLAMVTVPVLAPALGRLAVALRAAAAGAGRRRTALPSALMGATALSLTAFTVAFGWPYTPRVSKEVGLGVGGRIPVAAVQFIRSRGLAGQVFNKYSYGAYLIHELYPDTRVFMDSRNGVYGPELYGLYLDSLSSAAVAARVFDSYRFDYVLVDYDFYPGSSPDHGLMDYLGSHPEWTLAYFDDTSLLYLRDSPEHAGVLAADGYRVLDPVRYQPGSLRRAPAAVQAAFEEESRRALERRPGDRAARLLRLESHLAAGRLGEAREALASVLADDPNDIYSLITAARLDATAGDIDSARRRYGRALGLRPGLDDVRRELARLNEAGR